MKNNFLNNKYEKIKTFYQYSINLIMSAEINFYELLKVLNDHFKVEQLETEDLTILLVEKKQQNNKNGRSNNS